MRPLAIFLLLLLYSKVGYSNDTTKILIDLKNGKENHLNIIIYSPNNKEDKVDFIIPNIVPGTYMNINYHRFYKNIKAFTENNQELKVKKKGNHVTIFAKKQNFRLEYEVLQSEGDGRVWDNIILCAGTEFKPNSRFLINYQLITGYFENFKDTPLKVEYSKPINFYGSSGINPTVRSINKEVYLFNNYSSLIDNPILFSVPDTTAFTVDNATFNIAVYSETGLVTAEKLKPTLTKLMQSINDYMGHFLVDDYTFIFYFKNYENMTGMFKSFGLGSALEHLNSSIYYMSEPKDTSYKQLNRIASHEFFHTWTPLTIRSKEISDFNFDKPTMSQHIWFYEGFTDYAASIVAERYDLPVYFDFKRSIHNSFDYNSKRKLRSLTESSKDIINNSIFDWLGKIIQLGNFYEKGKLIAFCLDVELMIESNGKYRLNNLINDLSDTFNMETPFEDDQFFNVLTKLTYPETSVILSKYVEGKETPPMVKYFDLMGWKTLEKGDKVPSYGELGFRYDIETTKLYFKKNTKNNLGLKKGDTLISVNELEATRENYNNTLVNLLYHPTKNQEIKIKILRNKEEILLSGIASETKKLKYSYILNNHLATEKQILFRSNFYNYQK